MKIALLLVACSLAVVAAQQKGSKVEQHLPLPIQTCTKAGCTTEQAEIVIDAEYRFAHFVNDSSKACHPDTNTWTCGDPTTCAQQCAYDGFTVDDYANDFGVLTKGNELTMKYSAKWNSRLYLALGKKYRMFKLLNQEFTFDIDTATLECGMNGALFLSQMEEDGGLQYPNNKVGAEYGMGYCDAQCQSMTFVNGHANQKKAGLCCPEFDIWEANKISTQITSHPSSKLGTYECTSDCNTITDKNGCAYNPYQNNHHYYYGPGSNFTVDSTQKMTVVTQFITDDGTANGNLVDIRRIYTQNGKVIANSYFYETQMNSLTDAYCAATGASVHLAKGGIKGMGDALKSGMVLVFAIWTDKWGKMTWLDAGQAGSCPPEAGDQDTLMKNGCSLMFSNIRVGDINTTFSGSVPTVTPTPTTTTKTPTPTPTQSSTPTPTPTQSSTPKPTSSNGPKRWEQCGGAYYTGITTCSEGTCTKQNDWYSQCL